MRHLTPPQSNPTPLPPLGAWLRGAIELIALARSRWARRAPRA
jgi:hypothetical protein